MKSLYKVLAMSFFCLQLVAVVAFAESFPEASITDEKIISESFIKTIQDELMSLNAWAESEKADPSKSIRYFEYHYWMGERVDNKWVAFYEEYFPNFEYDIQKTKSIVTPYIGIVTFSGSSYQKIGDTKEECLKAAWQKAHDSTPTLKYSFQNGKWILKEMPPAYRKH